MSRIEYLEIDFIAYALRKGSSPAEKVSPSSTGEREEKMPYQVIGRNAFVQPRSRFHRSFPIKHLKS